MKEESDSEAMLRLLERVADAVDNDEPPAFFEVSVRDREILRGLKQANLIECEFNGDFSAVTYEGITIPGRLYRDELIAKRKAKSWPARFKKVGLVLGGAVGMKALDYVAKLFGG
jgi:hypothetical protein